MSGPYDVPDRLRELHEGYTWAVNAAIEEGREDLAWRLADDYLRDAMQAMTESGDGCDRPDCVICARPEDGAPPRMARQRGWVSSLRRRFSGRPIA
jgi:hypothetical protein